MEPTLLQRADQKANAGRVARREGAAPKYMGSGVAVPVAKQDGLTPETAKTSSSGGEWVSVGSAPKMAANLQTPVAAGFAEALSSLQSQGGGVRINSKGRTYMKGALKGMTPDQVTEKAKRMWATASPEIREKYAARARDRATESEKMAAFQSRPSGDPVMGASTKSESMFDEEN